jgi:hypothetical protein
VLFYSYYEINFLLNRVFEFVAGIGVINGDLSPDICAAVIIMIDGTIIITAI